MTKNEAMKAAKADGWTKAQNGFTLIGSTNSRFEEDRTFDYLLTGQPVPAGMQIEAKYRWNPNAGKWKQIA